MYWIGVRRIYETTIYHSWHLSMTMNFSLIFSFPFLPTSILLPRYFPEPCIDSLSSPVLQPRKVYKCRYPGWTVFIHPVCFAVQRCSFFNPVAVEPLVSQKYMIPSNFIFLFISSFIFMVVSLVYSFCPCRECLLFVSWIRARIQWNRISLQYNAYLELSRFSVCVCLCCWRYMGLFLFKWAV